VTANAARLHQDRRRVVGKFLQRNAEPPDCERGAAPVMSVAVMRRLRGDPASIEAQQWTG